MSDQGIITLQTFASLPHALAALAVLEAEGIPAIVADQELARLHWGMVPALGGVRLQVPAVHRELALATLQAWERAEDAPEPDPSLLDATAPSLMEEEVYREQRREQRRSIAAVLLLGPLALVCVTLAVMRLLTLGDP